MRRSGVRGGAEFEGIRLPDDFVDGVAFADGIHHLADEQREAAGFVFLQGVGGGEMIVEIFERLLLLLRGGGIIEGENFPAVAGDGFFALGRDGLELVIAAFHGVPGQGGVAEKAEAK